MSASSSLVHWRPGSLPDQTGAFIAMLRDPDYKQAVRHRQAAVETSRLIRLRPKQEGAVFG